MTSRTIANGDAAHGKMFLARQEDDRVRRSMPEPEFVWRDPHPRDDYGLVALDRTLTAERVIAAYRRGIFPWPTGSAANAAIPWVCPKRRAVLDFDRLHVTKSLAKSQQRMGHLRFTMDAAFEAVIRAAATAPRPGQDGTWITPAMVETYIEVHRRGHAHSVEAWDGAELMGGLYGVSAGGVFTGESMFTRATDVSKLCVLWLIERLRAKGATWIDVQVITPHFEMMGAREISREDYLERLAGAKALSLP
jgi:leucyl/phenylalanyl-tRNA--protein transferase